MSSALRPRNTPGLSLRFLADTVVAGSEAADTAAAVPDVRISGVTLRAQDAEPGDLFAALPGATAHGAQFTPAALEAGAAAVFTDPDGLEASARTALTLGFQGKMCIHPDQIAPVNRVFTPTDAEIAFAERVCSAFARAEAEGSAAIQLDGKFIDYPIVYRAQRTLQRIAAIRARGAQT